MVWLVFFCRYFHCFSAIARCNGRLDETMTNKLEQLRVFSTSRGIQLAPQTVFAQFVVLTAREGPDDHVSFHKNYFYYSMRTTCNIFFFFSVFFRLLLLFVFEGRLRWIQNFLRKTIVIVCQLTAGLWVEVLRLNGSVLWIKWQREK